MLSRLQEWATRHGYALACGEASVVVEALDEIRSRQEAGEFETGFTRARLVRFSRKGGGDLPEGVRQVLMIAVPLPAYHLTFTVEGAPFMAVVPPTYVGDARLPEVVRAQLEEEEPGLDLGLEPLTAPLKSVAARLGLVRYGRNNITYVPRIGSYFRLVGFLTRAVVAPAAGGKAQSYGAMPICANCDFCLRACPTGAIAEDRFLLRAERCRTLHSETPGPWPEQFPVESHDCLIGCLICQRVCPVNAGRLRYETAPVLFTEEETAALLREENDRPGAVGDGLRGKLDAIGMLGDAPVLGRNLGIVLRSRGAGPGGRVAP